MKGGMSFEDIFTMGFNRTSRKFGICREYRSVDMATYYMLRLTTDQAFDIIREKMMGFAKQSMQCAVSLLMPTRGDYT